MPANSAKASLWSALAPNPRNLRASQALVLALVFALWYVLTSPTLLPPFYFDNPHKAAFFFGEPHKVVARVWAWFVSGAIYRPLWVTLIQTLLTSDLWTVF